MEALISTSSGPSKQSNIFDICTSMLPITHFKQNYSIIKVSKIAFSTNLLCLSHIERKCLKGLQDQGKPTDTFALLSWLCAAGMHTVTYIVHTHRGR